MSDARCAGCARKIEWAKTPKGANVPLERLSAVTVGPDGVTRPAGDVLVSHFLTCPKAGEFSHRWPK
jgi:hypothetical protein